MPLKTLPAPWRDDKWLSIFTGLLVVAIFVLPPLVAGSEGRRPAADVVFAILLLSGVRALAEGGISRVLLWAAMASVATDVVSWFLAVPPAVVQGTSLLSLLLLLLVVLSQTFRDGPINLHRVQGGVAAYLLLGIAWAHAYSLVALHNPGAFTGAVDPAEGPPGFVYFSFVTLTTVGYGDVLPVHPAARSLATLEAVVGPLYLAILLARLVSRAGLSHDDLRPR